MPDAHSKVNELLGKEFGRNMDKKESVIKLIKANIREAAKEMDVSEKVINHFSEMRRAGHISIMIPYRNRMTVEKKTFYLLKLRSKSFQVSERMGQIPFDMFAMDVAEESGKSSEWLFKAERMLPEKDCESVTAIADAFYSHNVFGYFSIIDDRDMSDKEMTIFALFLQYFIKQRFQLHSWIFSVNTENITDKMILSPYLFKIERVKK